MMMEEISLHILDIVQNSISAGATLITITVEAQHDLDALRVAVCDNGCGMDEEMVRQVVSPFVTSRTTRKVGLGIPMFKAGAEATGGSFEIRSKPGDGVLIQATYSISHLDRPPLGDMSETMLALVVCNLSVDFVYEYIVDENRFEFDTRQIRSILGEDIALNQPEVMAWMKEYLQEGMKELNGGI